MYKTSVNFLCVMIFFCVLEFLAYCKDNNELQIMAAYVSYEIKEYGIPLIDYVNYEVIVKEDGGYTLVLHRQSFFSFGKYKKIVYNGIVE